MTLEEILAAWKKDSEVHRDEEFRDDLSSVSNLHARYLQLFFEERAKLLSFKNEQKQLNKLRWDYWQGLLTNEDLKANGWEPQPLKIPRSDIPFYLETDPLLLKINNKVDVQQLKIDALDSIVKAIMQRGFQLNTLVNWEKFRAGG